MHFLSIDIDRGHGRRYRGTYPQRQNKNFKKGRNKKEKERGGKATWKKTMWFPFHALFFVYDLVVFYLTSDIFRAPWHRYLDLLFLRYASDWQYTLASSLCLFQEKFRTTMFIISGHLLHTAKIAMRVNDCESYLSRENKCRDWLLKYPFVVSSPLVRSWCLWKRRNPD